MIDGRFLPSTISGNGAETLKGIQTMADVKTKSCTGEYSKETTGKACAIVEKKQQQVNEEYYKRAAELDEEEGTAANAPGPLITELRKYGRDGRVLSPVVGAFAEMSSDVHAITDLIASLLAEEHRSFFNEESSGVKAMFTERLYRSIGLSAHLGWARLLISRFEAYVEAPPTPPQTTRGMGHLSPDDMDAFEHEAYTNPEAHNHSPHGN